MSRDSKPKPKSASKPRARRKAAPNASAARTAILDAAEAMMVEEGYAAVTVRRVATRANVTAALVQYYFSTMDGLFLELYRRAADQVDEGQAKALTSEHALDQLWALNADGARTALAVEFMALANHRQAIRDEITRYITRQRREQIEALSHILPDPAEHTDVHPPIIVSVMIAAVARCLYMERNLGITLGHRETRAMMKGWIERLNAPTSRKRVAPRG